MPNEQIAGLLHIAAVYRRRRQFDLAEAIYETVLKMQSQRPEAENQIDRALTLYCLAELYSDQENYDKARPLYVQAIKIWTKSTSIHNGTSFVSDASVLNTLQTLCDQSAPQEEVTRSRIVKIVPRRSDLHSASDSFA